MIVGEPVTKTPFIWEAGELELQLSLEVYLYTAASTRVAKEYQPIVQCNGTIIREAVFNSTYYPITTSDSAAERDLLLLSCQSEACLLAHLIHSSALPLHSITPSQPAAGERSLYSPCRPCRKRSIMQTNEHYAQSPEERLQKLMHRLCSNSLRPHTSRFQI